MRKSKSRMRRSKIFSIIIPTLNEEEHISNLIRSIYAQSYRPLEVVLVDGGSKDGTLEVISSLKIELEDATFKMKILCEDVESNKVCGPANARNLGIESCSGEYVVFFDADVVLISDDFLGKLVDELQKSQSVYFKVRMLCDTWLEYHLALHPRTRYPAFRREVFSLAKFDTSLGFGEDSDLILRFRELGILPTKPKVIENEVGLHQPHGFWRYTVQRFWHARRVWSFIKKHPKAFALYCSILLHIGSFGVLILAILTGLFNLRISMIFTTIFCAAILCRFIISPKKTLDRIAFLLLDLTYGSFIRTLGGLIGIIEYAKGSRHLGRGI